MRLEVNNMGLQITPENAQDVVYIEKLLKLKKNGQAIKLYRHNVWADSHLCYIATFQSTECKKDKENQDG